MGGTGQQRGVGHGGRPIVWDRWGALTIGLLVAATAAAWTDVLRPSAAPGMGGAAGMGMPGALGSMGVSPAGTVAFLAAWGVMMAAMMLPSATPMIALYGAMRRGAARSGQAGIPTAAFALAYLALWVAAGVPIYVAGIALGAVAGANPSVVRLLPYALGLVLVAAGIYQFSPLKRSCLRACQSPLAFLMGHWRGGRRGTLALAVEHAVRCLGCCWGLMLVLVAAGAMSLPWVLLITLVVGVEKLVPGDWASRVAGAALVTLGLIVVLQPGVAAWFRGGAM
jgi:predicted metal-binding membrane protein